MVTVTVDTVFTTTAAIKCSVKKNGLEKKSKSNLIILPIAGM